MTNESYCTHLDAFAIRTETVDDGGEVERLLDLVFASAEEAALMESLWGGLRPRISLVAEHKGVVVGSIHFSTVCVEHPPGTRGIALGPVAVHPDSQNLGIGSAMVQEGLARCRESGEQIVFVLGHPPFFHRLGFHPAGARGFAFEGVDVGPAFMVRELVPGALQGISGEVELLPDFEIE